MLNRPLKCSWAMFKRCHLAKREEGAKQTERQVESREEMEQRVSVPSFASVSVHPPPLGEDREDRGRERARELCHAEVCPQCAKDNRAELTPEWRQENV